METCLKGCKPGVSNSSLRELDQYWFPQQTGARVAPVTLWWSEHSSLWRHLFYFWLCGETLERLWNILGLVSIRLHLCHPRCADWLWADWSLCFKPQSCRRPSGRTLVKLLRLSFICVRVRWQELCSGPLPPPACVCTSVISLILFVWNITNYSSVSCNLVWNDKSPLPTEEFQLSLWKTNTPAAALMWDTGAKFGEEQIIPLQTIRDRWPCNRGTSAGGVTCPGSDSPIIVHVGY